MTDTKERGHALENTNIIKGQGHALLRSIGSITNVLHQMTHLPLQETRTTESTERDLIQMIRRRRARERNLEDQSKKMKNAKCKLAWQRPECLHLSNSPIRMPPLMILTCLIMKNLRKTHQLHSQFKQKPSLFKIRWFKHSLKYSLA